MKSNRDSRTRSPGDGRHHPMAQPVPVLVGVGQETFRPQSADDFVNPIEAMTGVIKRAAEDAECAQLIDNADALHVVSTLSCGQKDAPSALSEVLGIHPAIKEYTDVGGHNPQWLVNRAADNLAEGRSEIAILAGCGVMNSVSRAMKAGKRVPMYTEHVEVPVVGTKRPGTTDEERTHSADIPIRIYPLIENALRAKQELTLEQQHTNLGRFGETFSAVAAANPYAWLPVARTAEEILTPTGKNRMISFPYTLFLNACPADMAAAVIMTTTDAARRMDVPEDKWIYIHGGQYACDEWFVGHRPDLADSPAIRAIVQDALLQSGIGLDEIGFFDFYSCFPCMPHLTCHVLGIRDDDPRPLTITGGLPYFGGPGNNYVMHSIVEAVNRCRADRSVFGMITSNGYYSTRHGVGVYSGQPPKKPWKRTPEEQFQQEMEMPEPMEVDLGPSGELTVDSYTVSHSRDGSPETGIVCGRTSEGKRAWAQTPKDDRDVLDAMMTQEWVGRRGRISGTEKGVNVVEFS